MIIVNFPSLFFFFLKKKKFKFISRNKKKKKRKKLYVFFLKNAEGRRVLRTTPEEKWREMYFTNLFFCVLKSNVEQLLRLSEIFGGYDATCSRVGRLLALYAYETAQSAN